MFTNILIGLLCYSVFLTLFLVGWHRHCKRMEKLDALSNAYARMEEEAKPRIRFKD